MFSLRWVLILLFVALSSCDELENIDQRVTVKLDPQLTPEAKALLRSDIQTLAGYQIRSARGTHFQKAFDGTTSADVLRFVDERINYIVPNLDNVTSRLFIGPFRILPTQGNFKKAMRSDPRVVMMARNLGMGLYVLNLTSGEQLPLRFAVGNNLIALDSPRVGLIALGPGYTMEKTPFGRPITPTVRISSLVHEARHSDCADGFSGYDIQLLKAGFPPVDHECGHTHIICPPSHPLSGIPACDNHAWGAYSIEALFAGEIHQDCTNCSELDRQQALGLAFESLSRVTVLDDMREGKLGLPEGSSEYLQSADPLSESTENSVQ